MASSNKNVLIIIALVAVVGIVAFLSTMKHEIPTTDKVEMKDVFTQKPSGGETDSDPVPSPAIVTSPEGGHEAGYAVQVYSFKDQNRANAALANLKQNGYNAYIEMSDLGSKGVWYRVRIGGLNDESQAKSMLEIVRKNFNSGIMIKPKI